MWPLFVPPKKVVQNEKVVQLFFEKSSCDAQNVNTIIVVL